MEDQKKLQDYYKLLNVPRNVDDKKLFLAYTAMVKKYAPPPDSSPALDHRAEIAFAPYQEAYNILSNPQKRKNYDLQLRLKDTRNEEEKLKHEIAEQENVRKKEEEQKKKQKQAKSSDFQSFSPIKNDPRLKDSLTGGVNISQFKFADIDQNKLAKLQKEREEKEKQKLEEKFLETKQYIENGDIETAITYLKELVEKLPKVAHYHSYLGLAMHNKGWEGYSQAEFKVALHFNPNDEIALKYYKNPDQTLEKLQTMAKQHTLSAPLPPPPENIPVKTVEKKRGFLWNLFHKIINWNKK